MSTTVPQRQAAPSNPHAVPNKPEAELDATLLADDDELRKELEKLAQENEQLLAAVGLKPAAGSDGAAAPDVDAVLEENRELRARVAELEELLAATPPTEAAWAEQQKEYEALLEEKSEVIRALHQKIHELRDGGEGTSDAAAASGDLSALPGDLHKLKAQLETERQQLREDEEALMQQMTQMEMTMSRERAELARQRAELQRLHSDIRHELEMAGRDATLRDRLATFQRRHQQVTERKGQAAPADAAPPPQRPKKPADANDVPPAKKPSSGLLNRLFGSNHA